MESEIRNKYASVVWSHKIQEKQADLYSKGYKRMETANILSASLTSVGVVSLIFTDQFWLKIISALISFVSVFVSAYFKSFKLNDLIKLHKATANQLLRIRDELEVLLLDIRMQNNSADIIANNYKKTLDKLHSIYDDAPSTTDKAVTLAREALNITKDNSFCDEEIDGFLPDSLRRIDT